MTDVQCIILDLLDCINSEMLTRRDFWRETEFGGSVEKNGLAIGPTILTVENEKV